MLNWFITAYEQIQLPDGFRIANSTDVPVHLWLFWTTNAPWRHKVAGERRGLLEAWGTYFCFDYFKMVEQNEAGDTITHTFDLHDWPFCETRWFVMKGEIDEVKSKSISPIFEKHNDYEPPPPPYWCAGNHDLLLVDGVDDWYPILWGDGTPLADHLPPETVALVIHCDNEYLNASLGLRPKGSAWSVHDQVSRLSQQWAVVGVNANIEAEAWKHSPYYQEFYLEGYVRQDGVVMFTNPYDRTPAGDRTWERVATWDICPDAVGILAEIILEPSSARCGIRKAGSTDNHDGYMKHNWTIIGCNEYQQIDFFTKDSFGIKAHLYIWGYVPAYASFYTDSLDKTITAEATWATITVAKPSNLAFFEMTKTAGWGDFRLRLKGATHEITGACQGGHVWGIVPVDWLGRCEAWKLESFISFNQVGEGH